MTESHYPSISTFSENVSSQEGRDFLWNSIAEASKIPKRTFNTPINEWIPALLYELKESYWKEGKQHFNQKDIEDVLAQFQFLLELNKEAIEKHGKSKMMQVLLSVKKDSLLAFYKLKALIEKTLTSTLAMLDKEKNHLTPKEIKTLLIYALPENIKKKIRIDIMYPIIDHVLSNHFHSSEEVQGIQTPPLKDISKNCIWSIVRQTQNEYRKKDHFTAKWKDKKARIYEIINERYPSPFQRKRALQIFESMCISNRNFTLLEDLNSISVNSTEELIQYPVEIAQKMKKIPFSRLPNHQDLREKLSSYIQKNIATLLPQNERYHHAHIENIQVEIKEKIEALMIEILDNTNPLQVVFNTDIFVHRMNTHNDIEETILLSCIVQCKWEQKYNEKTDSQEENIDILEPLSTSITVKNDTPIFSVLSSKQT